MTTPRENLPKVFRHEIPDWLPLVGHCDPCPDRTMEQTMFARDCCRELSPRPDFA